MKHYPAEFKADAVALYRSRPGAPIKSVATDLGVNTETLRNWIRPLTDAGAALTPHLRRRRGLTVTGFRRSWPPRGRGSASWRRDILRKAARYFAGETRW
ncbi:transposase [Streptomyces mirabilis]|uniref:transposase n=1 Tax=Streptomyces mirabilis TaxID=68239 RepID=UPI00368B3350